MKTQRVIAAALTIAILAVVTLRLPSLENSPRAVHAPVTAASPAASAAVATPSSAVSVPDPFAALAALAEKDPAGAIARAQALGRTDEEKNAWVTRLAREWAARDPQAAWDWLAVQDQPRIRALAEGNLPAVIIGAIARHAPAVLVRNLDVALRAGETPLGVPPVVAIHLGLEALAANQQLDLARQSVETWAKDPQKFALGEGAYVVVAAALGRTDFAAAGRWLQSLPASADRDIAIVEFPAQQVQTDPRGALEGVERNALPELRAAALRRAFNEWVEMNPADAGEWLGARLANAPPDAETDRMIATVVNLGYALKNNPATALQWTGLVLDASNRAALEARVILRWAQSDRSAAREYLRSATTLSFDRKEELIRTMERPDFALRED